MITNTNSLQPSLDPGQLRTLADSLRDRIPLASLAQQWEFESERDLLIETARSLGLEWLEGDEVQIDPSALNGFPLKLIHRFEVFPLEKYRSMDSRGRQQSIRLQCRRLRGFRPGTRSSTVVASPEAVRRLIKRHLGVGAETIDGLIALQRQQGDVEMLEDIDVDGSEDAEEAQQASVVRLVNEILSEAVEARASDIHIESLESGIKLRYRIDGVLQRQPTPPEMNHFRAAIVSRLKIMAKMNIAEKRIPQDGRIKLRVAGREIDLRVSIIPMLHGEGVVMRVLDKTNLHFSLRGIGMSEEVYSQFQKLIYMPHGIVLVTGPTGSGKTTTLYSALNEIKSEDTKIITTEDPIEYQLEGINQIQVHHKVGLTFAACLRAILRHDPDVVLVGEIRDLETAENATQARSPSPGLQHTPHNDAAGARFHAIMRHGGRTVLSRQHCRRGHGTTPGSSPLSRLQRSISTEPRGTTRRFSSGTSLGPRFAFLSTSRLREVPNTGFRGRIGIYELLVTNDEIRQLATQRVSSQLIKQAAIRAGMQTLRQDGWRKAIEGITSLEEVIRATKAD